MSLICCSAMAHLGLSDIAYPTKELLVTQFHQEDQHIFGQQQNAGRDIYNTFTAKAAWTSPVKTLFLAANPADTNRPSIIQISIAQIVR